MLVSNKTQQEEVSEVYSRKIIAENFDDAHNKNRPMILATLTPTPGGDDLSDYDLVVNFHNISDEKIAAALVSIIDGLSQEAVLLIAEGLMQGRLRRAKIHEQ